MKKLCPSVIVQFGCFAAVPLALAACSPTGGTEAPAAAVAGAAVAAPTPAKPAELAPDGVLAGPLGSKISEADRKTAFAAQTAALTTGQRKTWRGTVGGAYGYVEPGSAGLGSCRSYTHTIYFGGRPQSAAGQACREADGSWRSS